MSSSIILFHYDIFIPILHVGFETSQFKYFTFVNEKQISRIVKITWSKIGRIYVYNCVNE